MLADFRLADPEYVGFVPKSASEAIVKFRRLCSQGLSPYQYPETLIELASKLPESEIDKMNEWIVCPQGVPDLESHMDVSVIQAENAKERTLMIEAAECDEKSPTFDGTSDGSFAP